MIYAIIFILLGHDRGDLRVLTPVAEVRRILFTFFDSVRAWRGRPAAGCAAWLITACQGA
jgi:hypothetical protein